MVDRGETLPGEIVLGDRRREAGELAGDRGRRDDPPGSGGVAGVDELGREVEDDRDSGNAGRSSAAQERAPGEARDVRRIDDGREPGLQPPVELVIERGKRGSCCALVRLVAGHEPAVGVRGQDLVRPEQAGRQRRLAGSRGADEDDEAGLGERDRLDAGLNGGLPAYEARLASQPPPSFARTS